MKPQTITKLLGAAAALWLCGGSLLAQDNGGGPGGPGGNFDPAKFEERMLERVRQNLAITNDDEWTAVQPLVQKVMQARRETGGMGMGPGLVRHREAARAALLRTTRRTAPIDHAGLGRRPARNSRRCKRR